MVSGFSESWQVKQWDGVRKVGCSRMFTQLPVCGGQRGRRGHKRWSATNLVLRNGRSEGEKILILGFLASLARQFPQKDYIGCWR